MSKKESFKPINVEEVIANKNPGVAKILPGFVMRYIHRMMHLDYINGFLKNHGHLTEMDFINAVVKDFKIKETLIDFENVPSEGRFIFACNHPLGGFDGMVLMRNIYPRLGEIRFLANDILMSIKNLGDMPLPVNKHGRNDRKSAKAIAESYKADNQIIIFPSGLASRKIKGQVMDLAWKKHFISKAIESKRDVIPVFIDGRNSNRFYIVAKLRKFFRIKWNLEMFFLPDETYKQRGKGVKIVFGKPMSYTDFNKSKTHQQWADFVKDTVYKLANKSNTKI